MSLTYLGLHLMSKEEQTDFFFFYLNILQILSIFGRAQMKL